jgi:hypothetical protein
MRFRSVVLFALIVMAFASAADPVRFSGSLRLRGEAWSWFETPGYDDEYAFLGALARATAAQQVNPRFDWQVELAMPALIGLPDRAVAPAPLGQLGFGGSYAAANGGDGNAISIFPKQAFARFRSGSHSIRAGRFEFTDGTEVTPKNATLAALKNGRVAHRLIGNFGFSHVGRSVDGVQYVHNTPNLNVSTLAFRPTAGAFDVEGLDRIDDVSVLYGSLTYSRPNADERLFVIGYRDSRAVLKTDNRPAAVRNLDRDAIRIVTLGGHYLALFGSVDVLLWGAYQTGDWGVQDHRAHAFDVEAGYHFAGPAAPKLRAGFFRSSGDRNPADGRHGTFFQVLPTPRLYARLPLYNAMNSTDAFLQFSFKPAPKFTITSEAHLLSLTESADLWYAGGGAFQDETFGFAGRPSGGNDNLARVIDLGVDYAFNSKTSFAAYLGLARGGDIVDSIFAGDTARYLYLEVVRRF